MRPWPAAGPKTVAVLDLVARGIPGGYLLALPHRPPLRRRGRPPLPGAELLDDILALIANLPTYIYRRVHGPLLQRHSSSREERHPEGRVAGG